MAGRSRWPTSWTGPASGSTRSSPGRRRPGALLDALGRTYWGLGLFDRAVSLHTKARAVREAALGPDHPDTLASRNNLANAYAVGRPDCRGDRAARGDAQALRGQAGPRPPRHAHRPQQPGRRLLDAPAGQPEAIALHEATLKLRESKLGPDHPDTLQSRNNLAIAYSPAGRMSEAIALLEATLKLARPSWAPTTPTRSRAATTWPSPTGWPAGCPRRSRCTRRRSSCARRSWAPTTPTRSAAATTWPSPTQPSAGCPRRSRLIEATLKLHEAKLGPDHPDTLISRNNLADAYLDAGRTSEAIALHEATLELLEAKLGPDHPDTLISRSNLATAYLQAGRMAEAIALLEATLKHLRGQAGPRPPRHALEPQAASASAYESLGRWAEAEPCTRRRWPAAARPTSPTAPCLADDLAAARPCTCSSSPGGRRPSRCCASAWRSARRRRPDDWRGTTR